MNICGNIIAVLNTCSHLFVSGLFSGVNTELILREHFNVRVLHKFVLGIKHTTMNECVWCQHLLLVVLFPMCIFSTSPSYFLQTICKSFKNVLAKRFRVFLSLKRTLG